VAATITSDSEITYASFAIEKMETDENGDLIVHGKASDGGIDSDNQIVDPAWMAKAAPIWMETGGNVRVQHNPTRDPAGVGIKVETDTTGATWVTTKVIEQQAKRLVAGGALRAYSVGIARPTIVRDGTAAGGRITGGELVEISLVDRPANKRCGIQLVKSEDGWVGEIFGSDEDISKALTSDVLKGDTYPFASLTEVGNADISMTPDMSISFTPNDLMKIMQNKFVEKHYDELAYQIVIDAETETLKAAGVDVEKDHRDFSAEARRHQAAQGNALPDGSYPIPDTDALHRAAVLARSGHGNVSGARALIARRAKELGVPNPLSSSDSKKELSVEDGVLKDTEVTEVKEADADVTKDPAPKPKKGKKAGKKKMPPWLTDDKGDDAQKSDTPVESDDDDQAEGEADASCKEEHAHTEKCSGTPKSTSGAKDAADMKEIPNTSAPQESPMPAGRKTPDTKSSNPELAASLRFKSIGIDSDLGRLHDMTCPAYHPDDVAKYHPYADFKSTIDTDVWQRKAIDAACGPLQKAMAMTEVWNAAAILKGADEGELNDFRIEMHKAFRDANPGPTSYPSPGAITPNGYNRPLITDGHSASSPGHDGPNSSTHVASGPVDGTSGFDKPPLSAGHQSPSPSFMKNSWEYPKTPGLQHLPYAYLEKEKARRALAMMHDHLSHAFPLACPMLAQDAYRQEAPNAIPTAVGKSGDVETVAVVAEVGKVEDVSDDFVEKAKKKLKKKLGKKILAGKITVDEARTQLGRTVAQKAVDLEKREQMEAPVKRVDAGMLTIDEARARLGLQPWNLPETTKSAEPVIEKAAVLHEGVVVNNDPEVIKAAVTEALTPLLAKVQELEDYKKTADERFEKLANIADPTTNAFTGMAINPAKKVAGPAGVPSQAEVAERTQQMMIRQLDRTWRTTGDPAEREAAWTALQKYRSVE
jgi:hypothetical protein